MIQKKDECHYIAILGGFISKKRDFWNFFLGKPKKSVFFCGRTTKAFTPPPRLSGHRNFFVMLKKKVVFPLVVRGLPPPPS